MKVIKQTISVILFFSLGIAHTAKPIGKNCAISSITPSGRIGDEFNCCMTQLYYAWKYDLKNYYKTFKKYAKDFALFTEMPHFTNEVKSKYKHTQRIRHEDTIKNSNKDNMLFIVSWQAKLAGDDIHLATAKNPDFANELKQFLRPAIDIDYFDLPEDAVSVAIHVRAGGGYDKRLKEVEYKSSTLPSFTHNRFPTKIVPYQFYVDQMLLLADLFPETLFYAFVFTDDQHPEGVAELFREAINRQNVIIDSRHGDHHHTKNVLEDLFNMTKFDILIRPDSGFSWAAQLLGDHKVSIYPTKACVKNNTFSMDPPHALLADRINHIAEYMVFMKGTEGLQEKIQACLET